jgi:hypothetical protein
VHWVDKPSDALLRTLFEGSFLVLYLSHKEGFGLPIGEALSLGKPVVASHLSSMAEVGKEFADYTYFNSPSEIAGTVGAYLADEQLYRHRVDYIERAYRPYQWDLVVDTITRVLRGLDTSRELLTQPVPESLAPFKKVWGDLLASPGLVISWKATKVGVAKSGDLGFVSGTYEITVNDASGKPTTDKGKYVEVWEKQADGKWTIERLSP